MKGISRNHLARALQERSRSLAVEPDELERLIVEHRQFQGLDREGDNDEESERGAQVRVARLDACIARLTARSRLLVERRYRNRIPLKLLAQQFKQSLDSISGTLKRIRSVLRECMNAKEATVA